jgi:hypothetical protein
MFKWIQETKGLQGIFFSWIFLNGFSLGMRIGKTLKKLDSICCPQRRETKADTLKQLRPIGEGDQELEKTLDQEELT